jgi:hypothetical protein
MEILNKIIINGLTNETEIIPLTNDEIEALAEEARQQEENRLALKIEAEEAKAAEEAAKQQAFNDAVAAAVAAALAAQQTPASTSEPTVEE